MSKRTLLLFPMLTSAIVATAGLANAVVVDHTTFDGTQVAVFFSTSTTITCADGVTQSTAFASGFLSGGSSMTRSPGDPPSASSGIFVEIDSFSNGCTGEFVSFALGGISGGVTGPNHLLTSASLTGTTTVNTFDFPPVTATVTLNVTLTGDGPISVSRDTNQTRTVTGPGGPFTITVTHGTFRNRSAAASGTITIDGVVLPLDGAFGTLADNSSSQITVTK